MAYEVNSKVPALWLRRTNDVLYTAKVEMAQSFWISIELRICLRQYPRSHFLTALKHGFLRPDHLWVSAQRDQTYISERLVHRFGTASHDPPSQFGRYLSFDRPGLSLGHPSRHRQQSLARRCRGCVRGRPKSRGLVLAKFQ